MAVLLMEFGKSTIYQLISKVLFHVGSTANATSKTTIAFCWLTKRNGAFTNRHARPTRIAFLVQLLKLTHLRMKQEDVFYKINHILLGRTVQHCM